MTSLFLDLFVYGNVANLVATVCLSRIWHALAGWHVGWRGRIDACYLIVRGMNGWNGFLIGSCRACVPPASSGGPQTVGRRLRLHARPAWSSQNVGISETTLTNLRIARLPARQYLITRSMKSQSYLLMLNRRFYVIDILNTHTRCLDQWINGITIAISLISN